MNVEIKYKCPACGGDGIETCNNPDHGFLHVMSGIVGANESACPCCGHSQDHKMRKYKDGKWVYNKCNECAGTGIVDKQTGSRIIDEYGIDFLIEDFEI